MNNVKYSHRAILDLKEIKEYIILELCDEFIAKEKILKIKPYNKREIKKRIKQLYRYRDELIKAGEGLYKMILVLY